MRGRWQGVPLKGGSVWLEEHAQLKKELAASPFRRVNPPRSPQSLLLFGIISVSVERRQVLRCTWAKLLDSLSMPVRLRFVLGRNASDSGYPDVVLTPVEERLVMPSTNRKETRRSSGATYSSLSSFLKVYHFLRFAASVPEPLVALGDDDVFVQPQMLVAHAALLHEELLSRDGETALAAGAIEWYSWREATLVATGWDRGLKGARIKSQSSWRNCSPKGRGWKPDANGLYMEAPQQQASSSSSDRCFGPLPFLKGPLLFLSSPVVRWLNGSALVERDVRQAQELAAGRATAYKGPGSGRIPQDVSLGFWLSRHPTLKVVELQVYTSWADRYKYVGGLNTLLMVHRIPWERIAWFTESSNRLWSAVGAAAVGRVRCGEAICEPGGCAVAEGQHACRMEIELQPPPLSTVRSGCFACHCWASDSNAVTQWANSSCRFSRTAVPRAPEHCWRPRMSLDAHELVAQAQAKAG